MQYHQSESNGSRNDPPSFLESPRFLSPFALESTLFLTSLSSSMLNASNAKIGGNETDSNRFPLVASSSFLLEFPPDPSPSFLLLPLDFSPS